MTDQVTVTSSGRKNVSTFPLEGNLYSLPIEGILYSLAVEGILYSLAYMPITRVSCLSRLSQRLGLINKVKSKASAN